MANAMQAGQAGVEFILTVLTSAGIALDISEATVKQLIFRGPAGTAQVREAEFYTDGSDGKLLYESVAEDFVEFGLWRWQGEIDIADGPAGRTAVKTFRVLPNL